MRGGEHGQGAHLSIGLSRRFYADIAFQLYLEGYLVEECSRHREGKQGSGVVQVRRKRNSESQLLACIQGQHCSPLVSAHTPNTLTAPVAGLECLFSASNAYSSVFVSNTRGSGKPKCPGQKLALFP